MVSAYFDFGAFSHISVPPKFALLILRFYSLNLLRTYSFSIFTLQISRFTSQFIFTLCLH